MAIERTTNQVGFSILERGTPGWGTLTNQNWDLTDAAFTADRSRITALENTSAVLPLAISNRVGHNLVRNNIFARPVTSDPALAVDWTSVFENGATGNTSRDSSTFLVGQQSQRVSIINVNVANQTRPYPPLSNKILDLDPNTAEPEGVIATNDSRQLRHGFGYVFQTVLLSPKTRYTLSCYGKSEIPNNTLGINVQWKIGIVFKDTSGDIIHAHFTKPQTNKTSAVTTDSFERAELTFVSPDLPVVSAEVWLVNEGSTPGSIGSSYFDGVQLEQASQATFLETFSVKGSDFFVDGDLTVGGDLNLQQDQLVLATNKVVFSGNVQIGDDTTEDILDVFTKIATFHGPVSMLEDVNIGDNADPDGDTLQVTTNKTTFFSNQNPLAPAGGDVEVQGDFTVLGDTILGSGLEDSITLNGTLVSTLNNAEIGGDLNVNGGLTVDDGVILGDGSGNADKLVVDMPNQGSEFIGNVQMNDDLAVDGNVILGSSLSNTLTVSAGGVTFAGDLQVGKGLVVGFADPAPMTLDTTEINITSGDITVNTGSGNTEWIAASFDLSGSFEAGTVGTVGQHFHTHASDLILGDSSTSGNTLSVYADTSTITGNVDIGGTLDAAGDVNFGGSGPNNLFQFGTGVIGTRSYVSFDTSPITNKDGYSAIHGIIKLGDAEALLTDGYGRTVFSSIASINAGTTYFGSATPAGDEVVGDVVIGGNLDVGGSTSLGNSTSSDEISITARVLDVDVGTGLFNIGGPFINNTYDPLESDHGGVSIDGKGNLFMDGKLTVKGPVDPTELILEPLEDPTQTNAISVSLPGEGNTFTLSKDGTIRTAKNLFLGETFHISQSSGSSETSLSSQQPIAQTFVSPKNGDLQTVELKLEANSFSGNPGDVTAQLAQADSFLTDDNGRINSVGLANLSSSSDAFAYEFTAVGDTVTSLSTISLSRAASGIAKLRGEIWSYDNANKRPSTPLHSSTNTVDLADLDSFINDSTQYNSTVFNFASASVTPGTKYFFVIRFDSYTSGDVRVSGQQVTDNKFGATSTSYPSWTSLGSDLSDIDTVVTYAESTPGTIVATSDPISFSSLPSDGNASLQEFTFSTTPTLSSGQEYAIIVSHDSDGSILDVIHSTTNVYTGGQAWSPLPNFVVENRALATENQTVSDGELAAQTFITPSDPVLVSKIGISVERSSAAGAFAFDIQEVDINDEPTGSIVATTGFTDVNSLPTSTEEPVIFPLLSNVTLSASTRYAIVVRPALTSGFVIVKYSLADPYPDGVHRWFNDTTSTWNAFSSGTRDSAFVVISPTAATWEPAPGIEDLLFDITISKGASVALTESSSVFGTTSHPLTTFAVESVSSSFSGDVTVGSSLSVGSDLTVSDDLTTSGDANVGQDLTVNQNVIATGTQFTFGQMTPTTRLDVLAHETVFGSSNVGDVRVENDLRVRHSASFGEDREVDLFDILSNTISFNVASRRVDLGNGVELETAGLRIGGGLSGPGYQNKVFVESELDHGGTTIDAYGNIFTDGGIFANGEFGINSIALTAPAGSTVCDTVFKVKNQIPGIGDQAYTLDNVGHVEAHSYFTLLDRNNHCSPDSYIDGYNDTSGSFVSAAPDDGYVMFEVQNEEFDRRVFEVDNFGNTVTEGQFITRWPGASTTGTYSVTVGDGSKTFGDFNLLGNHNSSSNPIGAAIQYLQNTGQEGVVFVKHGTYSIPAAGLTLPEGISLRGEGEATVLDGSSVTGAAITCRQNSAIRDITIENGPVGVRTEVGDDRVVIDAVRIFSCTTAGVELGGRVGHLTNSFFDLCNKGIVVTDGGQTITGNSIVGGPIPASPPHTGDTGIELGGNECIVTSNYIVNHNTFSINITGSWNIVTANITLEDSTLT